MSSWWKALLVLALVVPMAAYIMGSLVSSGAGEPADRGPVIINNSASPTPTGPGNRSDAPAGRGVADSGDDRADDRTDDRDGDRDDDRDDDHTDDEARVVTPAPTPVDDDVEVDDEVEDDDGSDGDDDDADEAGDGGDDD